MLEKYRFRGFALVLFGLNRGALLVIGFELIERFCYYSALSLLALFLTATHLQGGLHWTEPQAIGLVGTYMALMYALPVIGGTIADRTIGHNRAIVMGGTAMAAGYLLLAIASLYAEHSANAVWSMPAFWTACAFLISGNALAKATLVVVLGDTFESNDPRRAKAYTYYWMAINVGGVIAGVTAGSIALVFGWAVAFGVAAATMVIAVLFYALLHSRYLGSADARRRQSVAVEESEQRGTALRLTIIVILAMLLCVFNVGNGQLFGTWSIVINRDINRQVGSFVIPTQWFTSIDSLGLIISAPLQTALWAKLESHNFHVSLFSRYALTLCLGAISLALFAVATAKGSTTYWLLPASAIMVMAIAESIAWTATYAAIYQLSPPSMSAGLIGAFYAVSLGLGNYFAGLLGRYALTMGYATFFILLAAVTALAGFLAFMIAPLLQRLTRSQGIRLI